MIVSDAEKARARTQGLAVARYLGVSIDSDAGRGARRSRRPGSPSGTTRGCLRSRDIDYTEARSQLEPYAVRGGSGIGNETEAGMMLGTIELREGRYLDAIRCLDRVPDSRKRDLLASAHLSLGDRNSAKRALLEKVRGDVPSDRGFIAELDGKHDAAIAAYVEALAAPVAIWRTYAAFRLKRMNVAPKTIKHIKAAQDAARNEGKIVVSHVADFYAKFSEIAEAIRKHKKITAPRKPMADAAIDKLRLPTRGRGKAPLVSVPRSMATIVRYDRDFRLFDGAPPCSRRVSPSTSKSSCARICASNYLQANRSGTTTRRCRRASPSLIPVFSVCSCIWARPTKTASTPSRALTTSPRTGSARRASWTTSSKQPEPSFIAPSKSERGSIARANAIGNTTRRSASTSMSRRCSTRAAPARPRAGQRGSVAARVSHSSTAASSSWLSVCW